MGRTDKEIYRVIDNVNSYYRINSESKKELLLNKYPNAAAAYSLRLLDGYYRGPLVRVRRDDGVEVDVYPDYNNQLSLDSLVTNVPVHTTNDGIPDADYTFQLSLSSLGEFVGATGYSGNVAATNATVCVWYDQSSTDGVPNDNDASQSVATSQPLIVSGGVIVTENGKPAIEGDGTNGKHLTTSDTTLSGDLAVIGVCSFDTYNNDSMLFGGTFSGAKSYLWRQGLTQINWKNDSENGFANFTVSLLSANNLIFSNRAGTDVSMAVNGSNNTVTENATQGLSFTVNRIGGAYTDQYSFDGTYQEIIFYNSDQSTNRSDIEEDINSFYQIDGYTPTQPLLDEFGGAAAAYSLRLLSSTYNGPLVRIRRTIDNTEVDVYPDSDGEFSIYSTIEDGGTELTTGVTGGSTDKTTLHEFLYGQDTDCMVVVWYDQAGSNDATQTTTTAQPKIYDSSTGVVTENGKPAVLFDGVDDGYLTPLASSDPSTYFITCDNNGNSGTPASPTQTNSFFIDQLTYLRVRIGIEFSTATQASAEFQLQYILHDTTSSEAAVNGATATSGTVNAANGSVVSIGQAPLGAKWSGHIYELIIYQSDQSTNRTGIESNINQHYNIY